MKKLNLVLVLLCATLSMATTTASALAEMKCSVLSNVMPERELIPLASSITYQHNKLIKIEDLAIEFRYMGSVGRVRSYRITSGNEASLGLSSPFIELEVLSTADAGELLYLRIKEVFSNPSQQRRFSTLECI